MMRAMDVSPAGTITFLFTDLENSTRLWERFPDAMKVAVQRHDAILRAAVESSGGLVIKTTGDGIMAAFDNAVDAVTASLQAQRALAGESWAETGPLRVRMGLHTGQAEQRGGDFFGPTVNRTARIMAAGHGGQVLLSASAAALAQERLPPGASLLDLGEHQLKDLGRPERLLQLIHADLATTFPALVTVRPAGAALPASFGALIGRHTEIAHVRERLDDPAVRLITLIGPGGSGKTRLALRVAEECAGNYRDGVCFVDLSSARRTAAVLVAIARALGLKETMDRPPHDEIVERLRGRRMLIVLDNLEQVTEAAGALAKLLGECPDLTLLATSREALHLRMEHLYPIPPLGLPPAGGTRTASRIAHCESVQLFIDRARAVRPDFQLTDDNAPAIAEICRRLDGLPLAIELAAARLRLLTPDLLRDRLGDRLALLRSGARDLPERQQTLRATMEWSYELLEPEEQRLFEFLAVFADADVAAIERVAAQVDGLAPDVIDRLSGLVDKNLVRQIDAAGGESRLTMLETIREFAADRLEQRPDLRTRAHRAHATHFADTARRSLSALMGRDRETALAALALESANLRIAWAYWVAAGDLGQLDKLADPLLILYDSRGWYFDTVSLTTDMLGALKASGSGPARSGQEIALRISLARALMATSGLTQEVEDAYTGALELFERGADVGQQFSVLRGLASLYVFRAQFDHVGRLGRDILALGEREGDPQMQVDGHLLIGTTLMTQTDLQRGLEHLERGIALFAGRPLVARTARSGNDSRVACYTTAAFTLWLLGSPDQAAARANAALALGVELEHPFTLAYARFHAALLHFWLRDAARALELATGALEVADEHRFRIWTAAGSCLKGAAQVGLGKPVEGLADISTGMALYQELRSPPVFWPYLLFVQAAASHQAGRSADSVRPLDAAIEIMSAGRGSTMLPELHLLKGDVLAALATNPERRRAAAEPWYRLALERSRALNARMTSLRAAMRLTRLRSRDGGALDPADALGPMYATFTEGFATADLREAQALLSDAAT